MTCRIRKAFSVRIVVYITLPNFLSAVIDHVTQLQGDMIDHATQLLNVMIDHVIQLGKLGNVIYHGTQKLGSVIYPVTLKLGNVIYHDTPKAIPKLCRMSLLSKVTVSNKV